VTGLVARARGVRAPREEAGDVKWCGELGPAGGSTEATRHERKLEQRTLGSDAGIMMIVEQRPKVLWLLSTSRRREAGNTTT
jgi:hypothetical protein